MTHTFQANFSKYKLAFSRFSTIKSQPVFFLKMVFTNNPDIKAELGRCAAIEAAGELS